LVLNKPEEAIRSFETAFKLDQDLDRKWRHVRYWYGAALFAFKRPMDALAQVEIGLTLAPDDRSLLDLKAALLSHLWHSDSTYEEAALHFFKFRASAVRNDYGSLDELIQLLTCRGIPEEAWPIIDENLYCSPFSIQELTARSGITIEQLRGGFHLASAYKPFRHKYGVDDYFVTMHGYGLAPSSTMGKALSLMLMVPFNVMFRGVREAVQAKQFEGLKTTFETALSEIARIFPVFGVSWLDPEISTTPERRADLLSLGVAYLPDVIVAEASRQFGYCIGTFGIPPDAMPDIAKRDWRDLYSDVGSRLIESVAKDWGGDACSQQTVRDCSNQ
jgi:tetratricopeptide (TPR) repeat protein